MPHDINGYGLNAGDEVLVRCKVVTLHTADEYCNVTLETVEPMYPGQSKTGITLNARQVVKAA